MHAIHIPEIAWSYNTICQETWEKSLPLYLTEECNLGNIYRRQKLDSNTIQTPTITPNCKYRISLKFGQIWKTLWRGEDVIKIWTKKPEHVYNILTPVFTCWCCHLDIVFLQKEWSISTDLHGVAAHRRGPPGPHGPRALPASNEEKLSQPLLHETGEALVVGLQGGGVHILDHWARRQEMTDRFRGGKEAFRQTKKGKRKSGWVKDWEQKI